MSESIETVYQENRALEEEIERLRSELAHMADSAGDDSCADYAIRNESLQSEIATLRSRVEEFCRENDIMRGIIAAAKIPCIYCGLDDISQCEHGFPGCAQADDLLCGQDAAWRAVRARIEELERELAIIEKPTGILEMQRMLDEANERIEDLEGEKHPEISIVQEGSSIRLFVNGEERPFQPHSVDKHYTFTHDQIKAAWAVLDGLKQLPPWVGLQLAIDSLEAAFAKLGIKRCPGCPDCRKIVRDEPWGIPGCNGDGFVIEVEDD